jgi:hypothetical protein
MLDVLEVLDVIDVDVVDDFVVLEAVLESIFVVAIEANTM